MFDGEHGIALHAMQGNRASSHGEGDVSWFFSSYSGDNPSKLVQQSQDSCLVMKDTSGMSSRLGTAIRTLLEVSWETECPFLLATVIPINFQQLSGIVTF